MSRTDLIHGSSRLGFAVTALALLGACGDGAKSIPVTVEPATPESPPNEPNLSSVVQEVEKAEPELALRIDALFERIAEGAFAETYAIDTCAELRQTTTLEQYRALGDRIRERLGALKSKRSTGIYLSHYNGAPIATVDYTASFEHDNGSIRAIFKHEAGTWKLMQINVNAPRLFDDPSKFRERVEVYAEVPAYFTPGTKVDLWDSEPKDTLVAKGLTILHIRIKIDGPFKPPTFPAQAFVTLALSKAEQELIRSAKNLSIRQHSQTPGLAEEP